MRRLAVTVARGGRRCAATTAAVRSPAPAAAATAVDIASSNGGDGRDGGSSTGTEPHEPRGPAVKDAVCILCDEDIDDFVTHSATSDHCARYAVCQALVNPEKHTAMMAQLWDHLRLDFDAVDEANALRMQRRRRRLMGTIKHLIDVNVLVHSIPRAGGSAGRRRERATPIVANRVHRAIDDQRRCAHLPRRTVGSGHGCH